MSTRAPDLGTLRLARRCLPLLGGVWYPSQRKVWSLSNQAWSLGMRCCVMTEHSVSTDAARMFAGEESAVEVSLP